MRVGVCGLVLCGLLILGLGCGGNDADTSGVKADSVPTNAQTPCEGCAKKGTSDCSSDCAHTITSPSDTCCGGSNAGTASVKGDFLAIVVADPCEGCAKKGTPECSDDCAHKITPPSKTCGGSGTKGTCAVTCGRAKKDDTANAE